MLLEWTDKDNTEKKWNFTLGSSKVMNDWVGLINSVKDGSFDIKKYEQISQINNSNELISNNYVTQPNNTIPQTIDPSKSGNNPSKSQDLQNNTSAPPKQ